MQLPSLEWVNQDSAYLRQLRSGFSWLRFAGALEPEFRLYHTQTHLLRMRGGLLVALLMWFLFTLFDLFMLPESFRLHSVAVRGALYPVLLFNLWATYRRGWAAHLQWIAGVSALAGGLAVDGVIWVARVDGFALPYEGIILMTVFFYFLTGLRFSTACICGWLTFAGYLAVELLNQMPAQVLLPNAIFLGSANLIGAFGCYFLEYSSRQTFLAEGLMQDIAERDFLTGLLNRRAFSERANRSWRQAIRSQQPVAVLMLDVDHFKAYNDHYGHAAGDLALQALARTLGQHAQRPLDIFARYGGEEFVGLWVGASAEAMRELAERIRADVEALALPHDYSSAAQVVTLSIGVAYWSSPQPNGLEQAQQLADEALYEAKAQGRNRVVLKLLSL